MKHWPICMKANLNYHWFENNQVYFGRWENWNITVLIYLNSIFKFEMLSLHVVTSAVTDRLTDCTKYNIYFFQINLFQKKTVIVGRRQISTITGLKENSDISDFTCSQLDQFVQNQVNLAFFNQCYLANVMVLKLRVL